MTNHYTKLLRGHIVGIIDSHGAVHSQFTGEEVKHHDDFWRHGHCKWRWNFSQGIYWFTGENKPTDEEYWEIVFHLEKRYSIPYERNGYHDIDFFIKKLKEEGDEDEDSD